MGEPCAGSLVVNNVEDGEAFAAKIGYPVVLRPAYTLGGSGGGIAYNEEELIEILSNGLRLSRVGEVLVERCIAGWKEIEYEVMRDSVGNCITVCNMENLDPVGIHTGDSITVAPAQTLTDKEYQIMRNASMAVLREIGVETGGSNVQFAVNPKTGRLIVIEMTPRVSRSSALASKATGFPIAKVAAKLAVGYTLDELMNDITGGRTPASFEPSIDYVVTKIPRFNFEKFAGANDRLTTQMKSVGEVMAIGRTQQESLQKALRGLEVGATGFDPKVSLDDPEALTKIRRELKDAGAERIWYIADAFRAGLSVDGVFNLTNIDRWFLVQIEELVRLGELTKRAWAHNVQVMVEGPGHVPLNQVAANMEVQKSICMGAPFYVLGPLVTDIAPGYDHITAAIGGAVAAASGAAFLCYVTPAEHLALPNVDDVKQGIVASKIAAHAADIAKGIPHARDIDDKMGDARRVLDWDAQFACALDPETAKAIRDARLPEDDHSDTCSMCGKFCAVRSMNKALAGEYIDIL